MTVTSHVAYTVFAIANFDRRLPNINFAATSINQPLPAPDWTSAFPCKGEITEHSLGCRFYGTVYSYEYLTDFQLTNKLHSNIIMLYIASLQNNRFLFPVYVSANYLFANILPELVCPHVII